jgi:hypothetical protein
MLLSVTYRIQAEIFVSYFTEGERELANHIARKHNTTVLSLGGLVGYGQYAHKFHKAS